MRLRKHIHIYTSIHVFHVYSVSIYVYTRIPYVYRHTSEYMYRYIFHMYIDTLWNTCIDIYSICIQTHFANLCMYSIHLYTYSICIQTHFGIHVQIYIPYVYRHTSEIYTRIPYVYRHTSGNEDAARPSGARPSGAPLRIQHICGTRPSICGTWYVSPRQICGTCVPHR